MRLILDVVVAPAGAAREARKTASRYRIGRGDTADWRLTDPSFLLSRLHCEVLPTADGWQIVDRSQNGTFLNDEVIAIGRDKARTLTNGDRIRIGAYVLQASIEPALATADHGSLGPDPRLDEGTVVSPRARASAERAPDQDSFVAAPSPSPFGSASDFTSAPTRPTQVGDDTHADAAVIAFLHGAGLPDIGAGDDPSVMLGRAGAALKALVDGLHAISLSRSSLKREMRITDSIVLSPATDNPLRVVSTPEQALGALLAGRYPAGAAVGEALERVRLHELSLIAAMRDSIYALLETLSPDRVMASAGGGGAIMPAQRKARAWEAFEALHAKTLAALSDDFDAVFGRTFAEVYERVSAEIAAERAPDRAGEI